MNTPICHPRPAVNGYKVVKPKPVTAWNVPPGLDIFESAQAIAESHERIKVLFNAADGFGLGARVGPVRRGATRNPDGTFTLDPE